VKGTGAAPLRGGRGTLTSGKPKKTVESYWPYASTLFDYTKRAMPFNEPGSMNDNDIYAVVAYILAEGGIISKDTVMNAKTLANVKMPNRNGFISDPRPDIFLYD
jgi:cytochrome c